VVRDDLAGVPDGETLRRLESGLQIVRRRKHEPIDFEGLARNERVRLTDKRFGSKFLQDWGIVRLTDWIAEEIDSRNWTVGTPLSVDVAFDRPVGIVSGEETAIIRIISDGRYVHAFPVEDRT
jgi:hypothetical protein